MSIINSQQARSEP